MAQSRGKGNYVINTFNGMAYGFFASLIIGTILKQLGTLVHVEQLVTWGTFELVWAMQLMQKDLI